MRRAVRTAAALPLLALLPLGYAAMPAPQEEHTEHHEEDLLHEAMDTTQAGMRVLGRSLRSAEGRDDALAAAAQMRTGLTMAVGAEPTYPDGLSDPTERGRFRVAFQRMLVKTLDTTLQLEDALFAGDMGKAQELFGALRELKSEGHDKYQVEDDDH